MNIELVINGITRENRQEKLIKAIRNVSRRMRLPVRLEKKERTGEPYLYAVQQELSDQWTNYYKSILKHVYSVVVSSLGLPVVEVETIKKAIGESTLLHYRGKVLYNPETGLPINKKAFENLMKAIENYLNRNTKHIADRVVLDSIAIGKILNRMSKYLTTEEMKNINLSGLKYRGKTFDWIRDDIKNLCTTFGEQFTRSEMAKFQVATDYVAQLVTKANNKIKGEITDTVLASIRNKRSKSQVTQDLFNRLGGLNRDWKRIADTEIVNTSNLAHLLEEVQTAPSGEKVYFKRFELAGCCDKCAKYNGKIALWSDTPLPDDKIKDPYTDTAIWEGKENDRRMTKLVPGTIHPHCRGGWARWGGNTYSATAATLSNQAVLWNKAVKLARAEWKEKGVENPNDQTEGYIERINVIYRDLHKEEKALS